LMEAAHNETHDFHVDQVAHNTVISIESLPTAMLPARYNWTCHWALPAVSPDGRDLLRPLPPHEPLVLFHQTSKRKQGSIA